MSRHEWVAILCLVAGLTSGCGADGESTDIDAAISHAAPDAGAAPDAAAASNDCPDGMASVTGQLTESDEYIGDFSFGAGAEVCSYPDHQCVTAAVDGTYQLCVASSSPVALTYHQVGYAAELWPISPTDDGPGPFDYELYSDEYYTRVYAESGIAYPPIDSANIMVELIQGNGQPLAGGHVTLSPTDGVLGPVYLDKTSSFADQTFTATSASGKAVFGVPPGDYDVFVEHATANNCLFYLGGWASPTAGAVTRIPAVAGLQSFVLLICR